MKLLSFTYKSIMQNDWELIDLTLNPKINLLVAQNATGKSTTLKHIILFSQILKELNITSSFPIIGYECIFQNDRKTILKYNLKTILKGNSDEDPTVHFYEELYLDDKLVLTRDGEDAEIYSMKLNEFTKISPPKNKLIIHVRRDRIEYPYLEDLMNWTENTKLFEFSRISPLHNKTKENYDVGKLLSKVSLMQKNSILKDINSIGYQIENISTLNWEDEYVIEIKEKKIENEISQRRISQGLFRALSVLIFIEFYLYNNKSGTLLVDDLGEGLDYERATKLGKLLVQKLENSNIQFIATSNDSFLMDVVPIKYWNILQRDGNTVRALNYQNSKEQFDEFKLSGLSNFYLFSSDFLTQKQD